MSQNCHIGKRKYTEAEYYDDKRIAQNAIKDKLEEAKDRYSIAQKYKHLYQDHELHDMRVLIQKLEGQWLDAGYTGD